MDIKDKITEQPSRFDHLEQMSVTELLHHINDEDQQVAEAVNVYISEIKAAAAIYTALDIEGVNIIN